MEQVAFRQMKDGTREEYLFLDGLEAQFNEGGWWIACWTRCAGWSTA